MESGAPERQPHKQRERDREQRPREKGDVAGEVNRPAMGRGRRIGGDLAGQAREDEERAKRRDYRLVTEDGNQGAIHCAYGRAYRKDDRYRDRPAEPMRKQPRDENAVHQDGQWTDR